MVEAVAVYDDIDDDPVEQILHQQDAPQSAVRAKILVQEPGAPVQLTLPARDAATLVMIAEDFSRTFSTDDIDSDRMVDAAAAISAMLRDCLMARARV